MKFARIVTVVVAMIYASIGYAARPAKVTASPQAPVLEAPQAQGAVLENLTTGTMLVVSNLPTEGFYKVRTPSGIVGWIAGDQLQLFETQDEDPLIPGSTARPASSSKSQSHNIITLRGLGGVGIFSLSEIKTQLQFSGIQFGLNYGGEIGFFATEDFALLLRVERMQKSTLAVDSSTQYSYQLAYSSLPVMMGLEYRLARGKHFGWSIGLLGGLGVNTQFKATALNLAAPNETLLSGIAFTGLFKLNVEYILLPWLQVFSEAGYRILSTSQQVPTTVTNGDELIRNEGAYVPLGIDFSGPVVSLGVALSF